MNLLGSFRLYFLAATIFMSGFLQGYDAGVIGGVLTFKPFQSDLGYSTAQQTQVNALTVGLEQVGCFIACPLIYPVSDRFGRRKAVILAVSVFILGAILQTINTGNLGAWYFARIVAGVGQGAYTSIVPSYSAEMAPAAIRGRLGSMYQWMYTIGIFTAYWINYGVQQNIGNVSKQWQIPVSMQILWGGLFLFGMIFQKESVRWLAKKGRYNDAWKVLTYMRNDSGPEVTAEFEELKLGIEAENASKAGLTVKEMLTPVNRRRMFIASLLFLFQQGTGSGALATFGPQFFKLLVGKGNENILLTGLFGAVKVVACTFFITVMADRFGRRILLTVGSYAMFACMLSTSLVLKFYPPPSKNPHITNAGAATIALLFVNIAFYNNSWGPLPWAYAPEIFNTRTRGAGMAVAIAVHWAFSVCFAISTPYQINKLGWGVFLFYAIFDFVMGTYVAVFLKETKGKSLELLDRELMHQTIEDQKNLVAAEHGTAPSDTVSERLEVNGKDHEA